MSHYSQVTDDKHNLKILLSLLEKAEQILGLINLPESTINKYNHLKEISFEKLNLDFQPIKVKKQVKTQSINISRGNFNTTVNSQFFDNKTMNNFTNMDLINRLRTINIRKNVIIEYLFELIEKFKLENNNYMKQYFIENPNTNLNYLIDKALGNMNNLSKSANLSEDFEFELKLEELKVKDYLGKSDICYRKFLAVLKSQNFATNNLSIIDPNNYQNLEDIIAEYEKKFEELKWAHEQEIKEFREKFNDLRIKYNPELESEYYKLRDLYDVKKYIIDEINLIVDPIYEKYYNKNIGWYEKIIQDLKYEELNKVYFLSSLVNKFFADNKYLLDLVSDVQKEKSILIEERNFPFVVNAIQKNSILQEIHSDLDNFEKNNDLVYKNIDQVIEYINKNIESLV